MKLILSIQNGSIAHFGAFRDDFVFGDSFLILDFKNTLIDYGKSCIFNDNIKSAYLFGAKIQKSMQGKGHFSKLLNAMILYCKEKKISRIFLECKKDNSTALSIYKHLGFFMNNKILKKYKKVRLIPQVHKFLLIHLSGNQRLLLKVFSIFDSNPDDHR